MSSTAVSAANTVQMIKGERHLFASSDDNAIVKQILATHSPDGREVQTRPLLRVVEDILQRATPTVVMTPAPTSMEIVEDKMHHTEVHGMLEALAYTIHRLSCEITCKCNGGSDAHATALALFHTLSNYTWDAKLVLALAAFSVTYGEFWLTAQLHTVNPLAKSVALLKHLPDMLEHTDVLRPRFDAISHLTKAMLDVTKCITEFKELPSVYISPDAPDMAVAMAHIPTAVYWTVRSMIACASQIFALIGLGHEYISSTTETWELSSLAHKLSNIHGHLTKQLALCYQHIDERKHIEAYQTLVHLFETIHIDNMKILRALMNSKDDLPLIDGSTKRRVGVDVLRRKIVMLFITDLDISHEELFVLIQIYNDAQQGKVARNYEIVWLPIIDRHVPWLPAREDAFDRLASTMPWYSAHHHALVAPPVSKYIRDVWRFDKRPMLVVLDPQGKVVCPNALHMMWIWGSLAFPFTSNREEALWKEETWRLEFLVDEIDPTIITWAREGRYVCLYGGENVEWIRRFTALVKRVAQEAKIPLELVYVGKSNPKIVKKAISVIAEEKLSGYWQDPAMMWFFWARLESMWRSKMQHGRTIEDDPIMQEVLTMLTFDGGNEGWALISRGSVEMVKAQGRKMADCLAQFDGWKENAGAEGFVPALTNALAPFHAQGHCTHLILPGDAGRIKEKVVCAECRRPMEEFVLYRCCNN